MKPQLPANFRQLAIIATIAVIALGSGAFVAGRFSKRSQAQTNPSPSTEAAASPQTATSPATSPKVVNIPSPSPTPKEKFQWGVHLRPGLFPTNADNMKALPGQFALMKDLGITTVRTEYEVNNESLNKTILQQAKAHGLQVVFIIPFGPNDIKTDPKLYDNAYKYVKDIVSKHKGQVPVWQLGTEVATVAMKSPNLHGVDAVDYPDSTYKPVATWMMAATRAVKDADPGAKRLINDQWIHVGFFDKFIKEGGQFEMIGWNWFSDMGTNFERPVIDRNTGQRYDLMKKLKSYNKEIWLTEVNRRNGNQDGDSKAQADFIETMAKYAYNSKTIKGVLVFHLMGEQGYGLVNVDEGQKKIGSKKEAFTRYQGLIRTLK